MFNNNMILEIQNNQEDNLKTDFSFQNNFNFQLNNVCQMLKTCPNIALINVSQNSASLEYTLRKDQKNYFKVTVELLYSSKIIHVRCLCKIKKYIQVKQQSSYLYKLVNKQNNQISFNNCKFYYENINKSINVNSNVYLTNSISLKQLEQVLLDLIDQSSKYLKNFIKRLIQKRNQNKIIISKMNQLKDKFQQNRITHRQKSTKICLIFPQNSNQDRSKVVMHYMQDIKKNTPLSRQLRANFKKMAEKVKNDIQLKKPNQKQNTVHFKEDECKILKGILLQKQQYQQELQIGGNGIISKYICKFQQLLTVCATSQGMIDQCQSRSKVPKLKNQIIETLVKKMPILNDNSIQSFKNELTCLFVLRDRKCQQIAQYYKVVKLGQNQAEDESNQKETFIDSKNLYLKYYKHPFSQVFQKPPQVKIKIVMDLIQGIHFLSSNSILHRDIKPSNIRLDNKSKIKIIDFGSSCFSSNIQLKQSTYMSGQVRNFTKEYNLQYHKANISFIMGVSQFLRHPFYDLYAFGKLMQRIFNNQVASCPFIQQNMKYVSQKCMQCNPEDRLSPEEVKTYLSFLLKAMNQMQEI